MDKQIFIQIKKSDEDQQLVYGEVYAPNVPDSQGDFMLAEDIQSMAHNFVSSLKSRKVDINHNNKEVNAAIVESFIAREDDPVFISKAWVVGVKVRDQEIWNKIKAGDINGFSMQAVVKAVPQQVELEIPPVVKGKTQKTRVNQTKEDTDHEHSFELQFSEDGEFMGGKTSTERGHFHLIKNATATEEAAGHKHRYSFIEALELNA